MSNVQIIPGGGGVLDLNLYGDVPTKKKFSPCSRIFALKSYLVLEKIGEKYTQKHQN